MRGANRAFRDAERLLSRKSGRHLASQSFGGTNSSTASNIAATYNDFGDPQEVLKLESKTVPTNVSQGEVLVRMLASPINPSDLNQVEGRYPILPSDFPAVPGNEGVGKVVGVGPNVKLAPGDRVLPKSPLLGTWASHLLAEENQLTKCPEKLDDKDAAQLTVNPCAALRMLEDFVTITPGRTSVVQNGATSAVGRAVIQFAEKRAIPTINFIRDRQGSDEVKEELYELGATEVLCEGEEMSEEVKMRLRNLPPAVLGLSCVGGKPCSRVAKQLHKGAHLVVYGGMNKEPMQLPTSALVFSDVHVHGFWLSRWYHLCSDDERERMHHQVAEWMRAGDLIMPSHSVPLDALHEAVRASQSPRCGRKVILTME